MRRKDSLAYRTGGLATIQWLAVPPVCLVAPRAIVTALSCRSRMGFMCVIDMGGLHVGFGLVLVEDCIRADFVGFAMKRKDYGRIQDYSQWKSRVSTICI